MNNSFVKSLSNPDQPIPGGGAAAAYAGCVALALLEKIIRVEMRRHQNGPENSAWEDLLGYVLSTAKRLYQLRDEDGRSYMRLVETKTSGKEKEEITEALKQAIDCPMEIMKQVNQALNRVRQIAEHCKRHLLSDLQVVCELLGASGLGAYHIARANIRLIEDPTLKADYESRISRLHTAIPNIS